MNVVNRGFLSARFLLAEGPTLKLLHQQSLQESTVQQNRGVTVHQHIPEQRAWAKGAQMGRKEAQEPAASSATCGIWDHERPSGTTEQEVLLEVALYLQNTKFPQPSFST